MVTFHKVAKSMQQIAFFLTQGFSLPKRKPRNISTAAIIGTTCRSYEYIILNQKSKEEMKGKYFSKYIKLLLKEKVHLPSDMRKLNKKKPQAQHEPAGKEKFLKYNLFLGV